MADALSTRRAAVRSDHDEEPLTAGEKSRIWQPRGIAEVELLYGSYRRFSFARHFHAVTAIGVVEAGVMRTYFQGATYRAPAQTSILFNPGEVHAPQPADAEGWSFRMFYIEDTLIRELSADCRPLWFVKPFVENPSLHAALLRMHRTFEHDSDPLESESHLISGLVHAAQHSLSPLRPDSEDIGRTRVNRVRDYLWAHYMEKVTLRQLAAVADLSPYHLLRSFRAQVGITPHTYLVQARIEWSRKFLRAGNSIVETALKAGFTDQSHFTRQFKKFTGVTPGKYLPDMRPAQRKTSTGCR